MVFVAPNVECKQETNTLEPKETVHDANTLKNKIKNKNKNKNKNKDNKVKKKKKK